MNIVSGATPNAWGVWSPADPKQIEWTRYLDEVRAIGYRWTELGPLGYMPTDPEVLAAELRSRELGMLGAYIAGRLESPEARSALLDAVAETASLSEAVGGRFLVFFPVSYRESFLAEDVAPVRPRRLDENGWREVVETSRQIAELLADRFPSLRALIHPHADTYLELPEDVERYLELVDDTLVGVCMDLGHYAYRGGDAPAFLRRHHARTPYLHLKNVDAAVLERVNRDDLTLYTAVQAGVFCEPEAGAIDLPEVTNVLRSVDWSGFAGVEHDMFPCPPDLPAQIGARSLAYYRTIGLA